MALLDRYHGNLRPPLQFLFISGRQGAVLGVTVLAVALATALVAAAGVHPAVAPVVGVALLLVGIAWAVSDLDHREPFERRIIFALLYRLRAHEASWEPTGAAPVADEPWAGDGWAIVCPSARRGAGRPTTDEPGGR